MRKKIICLVVILTVGAMAAITVTAHGGHGRFYGNRYSTSTASAGYPICNIEDCAIVGTHSHSRTTCYGHYYGDGHDYHDYCPIEDCAILEYHEHDGEYYFPHSINDYHDYHGYCNIANCTIDGYHDHNGTFCFGYDGNRGYNHCRRGVRW